MHFPHGLHLLLSRRAPRLAGVAALLWAFSAGACGHLGIDLGDSVVLDGAEGGAASGGALLGAGGSGGPGVGGFAASASGGTSVAGGNAIGGTNSAGGSVGGSGLAGAESSGGESTASGGADLGTGGSGGLATGSGGVSAAGGSGSGGRGAGGVSGAGGSGTGGGSSGSGGSGAAPSVDCSASDSVCQQIAAAMVTRLSFDGVGQTVTDSLGGGIATLYGTSLNGSGQVSLSGVNAYVELPPLVVSSLTNATFEIWFVWRGGAAWQRLFEFGSHDAMNNPLSYLFATPLAGGSDPSINALAAVLRHPTGGERQLRTSALTATGVLTQVVLVANDDLDRLSLYKNGQWLADLDTPVTLSELQDQTNRLGRSLFAGDPDFNGDIMDFRVYGEILTAEMIQKSYSIGADGTYPP